jgi:hypothetical protein
VNALAVGAAAPAGGHVGPPAARERRFAGTPAAPAKLVDARPRRVRLTDRSRPTTVADNGAAKRIPPAARDCGMTESNGQEAHRSKTSSGEWASCGQPVTTTVSSERALLEGVVSVVLTAPEPERSPS